MLVGNKRWSFIAIILVAIGLAGMAYQQFEFGEDLPHHNQKWTLNQLKSLTINSDYDVDVKFINSNDNSNYVEISGNMKQDTIDLLKETDASDDSLKLNVTQESSWSFISFNFNSTKLQITVALSNREDLDDVQFKLKSNNGTFSDLSGKTIQISSTSGNLALNTVRTNQLTVKNASGNITANQVEGDTEIKLSSGNIKINELSGSLKISSTSGNITAEHVNGSVTSSLTSGTTKFTNFTGAGVFKSTSGDITLTGQRSDSLDINNKSGNVTLSLDNGFKGIYDLKTTSGNIDAPESPRQNTDLIKIRVTSGNIRIK